MTRAIFIVILLAIAALCNCSFWGEDVPSEETEEYDRPSWEDSVEDSRRGTSDTVPPLDSSEASRRASYGESCDEWIQCNPFAWFQCKEGHCGCMNSDMTYDSKNSKCVGKASKQCRYGVGHLGDTTMVFRVVDCIGNSVYNAGICSCITGMYATPNGTCAPLKEFGETCEATIECFAERGLACVNGTCECNGSRVLVHSQDREKCIALAGQSCRYEVAHVEVKKKTKRRWKGNGGAVPKSTVVEFVCTENAFCGPDGLCVCSTRSYPTSNKTCANLKGHADQCDSSYECNQEHGLQCTLGVCACKDGFTWDGWKCKGLVNSACLNNYDCFHGSHCGGYDQGCICDSDYVAHPQNRMCVPAKNLFEACEGDFQCKQQPNSVKCIDSKCQCDPERSVFATVTATTPPPEYPHLPTLRYVDMPFTGCVPLPGLTCHEGLCAPSSYCDYPNPSFEGTCTCESPYTLTKNRTCEPGCGQACGTGCMDGLVCKNQVCGCKLDDQSEGYDAARQTCYSKFDEPCETNEDCGPNATCSTNQTGSIMGFCECTVGFVPDAHGNCVAMAGGPCRKKVDCDTIAGLNCVQDKCECLHFGVYDLDLRKCRGKTRSVCSVLRSHEVCVDGAECKGSGHPELPSRCKCTAGYGESENYTCVKSAQ